MHSFAIRLSLRFMFVLMFAVMLLSLFFLIFTGSLVRAGQTSELRDAESKVFTAVKAQAFSNTTSTEVSTEDSAMLFSEDTVQNLIIDDIPYYLMYTVYINKAGTVLATNDPFLPLLDKTDGKAVRYFAKDFFIDGNLDILYYADSHRLGNENVICEVSINVEKNAFSMILSKLPLAMLSMILPVLLLSFLLSLFITKNTIKPVVKITRAAQSMTTENLDGQLPLTNRNDEIDELSRTFNSLFLRIKADFDRERQFSSNVSHELNTPLTVISGQTNLLLRWGKNDPVQLEKSLNSIKNESKFMHNIIENLLQMSRIESGRIKPQFCNVDVRELFERVADEFKAIAPDVHFEIKFGDARRVYTDEQARKNNVFFNLQLYTDSEMLHQILTVLVSNSVKFAGNNCTVCLTAIRTEYSIFITESDDGPGISCDALPHVFERFYRADEAHVRSAGGSGLGLAIAKTLCDAVGAELSAGNAEPHGALFKLSFKVR